MALIDFKEVEPMCKKKAVAVLLAATFSLSLPLSSIAAPKDPTPTPEAKVAQAPAKSQQAIAPKKARKKIAKKKVKRSAHRRIAKRKA